MSALHLQRNADGTITVRVGRQIEHIPTQSRSKAEVFDHIKMAASSKGAKVPDITITEWLFNNPA